MTSIDGLRQQAVVVELIEKMAEKDGWCGETHIQKSTYFLQALAKVPVEYEFVMYRHGPYSFDLHDDLIAMKAKGFLKTLPKGRYGPSFRPGEYGDVITRKFSKTLAQYAAQVEFIAEQLSPKSVIELERLATALFVSSEKSKNASENDRAEKVISMKPHIDIEIAKKAISEVDNMISAAQEIG